ncbi:TIGR02391 family protein [Micromonospora purpureochromogenes]|uniref:TIGR02391 family protein n=1 Tax=Micromonospora purpureochromogenes TaxID=47872 RepID=UPI0033254ADA
MSKLSLPNKTFLEAVLGMGGGYVLDFSNASFANFFGDLNVDIYNEQKYPGFGDSKANRMRALWKGGSDAEVSSSLAALADYIEAKKAAPDSSAFCGEDITDDQLAKIRKIAEELGGAAQTATATAIDKTPASFTTEATVTNNKIQIEIHEDIYNHIGRYLATGDHFHAVEESYKLVRGKLREITGKERATDAFAAANIEKLFGHQPANDAEKDFFEGVKFLNMAIQFLRNEKAHTPATPLEPNLAIHYISLASLAYDLITRYVSEETIKEIEDLVLAKRHSYRSHTAFYREFDGGKWLRGLQLPDNMASSAVRKVLKNKWLDEADFTRSYDHSNIVLMRLELVVDELAETDLDQLLDLPTQDSYGNDQSAGMLSFLEFVQQQHPDILSQKAKDWIAKKRLE